MSAQPLPEDAGAPARNEVDVADVTQPDPQETVPVRTIGGVVAAPAPPAPRDGTIAAGRAPVYSDMHCPLLVDDEDKLDRTVVERLSNAEGEPAGTIVHRRPEQLVVDPVSCPSCGKVVERFQLVPSPVTGTRDCAIAVQARGNPAYTRLFGAMAGNQADAEAEAAKHGKFGERVLRVLGPRRDDEPALRTDLDQRGPRDPQDVPGSNLTPEAAAEHRARGIEVYAPGEEPDAARASSTPAGAYAQPTETVAPAPRNVAQAEGDRGPTAPVEAATDQPVPGEYTAPEPPVA